MLLQVLDNSSQLLSGVQYVSAACRSWDKRVRLFRTVIGRHPGDCYVLACRPCAVFGQSLCRPVKRAAEFVQPCSGEWQEQSAPESMSWNGERAVVLKQSSRR